MAAIEVEGLVVSYGDTEAVRGLSLSVAPGEVLTLLGPNGAGKTTTVETICGLRERTSGVVRVLGLDPRRQHTELVRVLGVLLQNTGLYPMLGPRRLVQLYASYYDRALDPEELLERVGLGRCALTHVKHLSGGERQRLALALALVGRPSVAVLDEPTAGIDPAGRLIIREVIAELRADGVAVLVTTHELAEAEHLADRVVIIDSGRVVAEGALRELAREKNEFRFRALGAIEVAELGAHLGAPVERERPEEYRVLAAPSPANLAALTGWLAARDIALDSMRTASLEDLYLSLVGAPEPHKEPPAAAPRRRRGRRAR